ncbi:MAG: SemiSWEET family transporter [Nanoarchaeota archaeon]
MPSEPAGGGPIMTIPQLCKIWVEKNAAGVSAVSWIAYLVTAFFWLTYGIMHKEKPIIFTYSGWIIIEVFIIIGTFVYG